jgi:hypothetical protein
VLSNGVREHDVWSIENTPYEEGDGVMSMFSAEQDTMMHVREDLHKETTSIQVI